MSDPAVSFAGEALLAPLTKGGNLPFRRLLVGCGATFTTGEMAVAQKVVRVAVCCASTNTPSARPWPSAGCSAASR